MPDRLIKSQLWRRGVLSWKYHKGQAVIDQAYQLVQHKLFLCNISRRFGKSYWAVTKALECALTTKDARIKIASAYLTDVEEFIVPAFRLVMNDMPEDIRPTFNTTKKKFTFANGAEIKIIGLDKNPDGGRGNYCDLFIFDEAAYIKNLSYLFSSVVVPATMYRPNAKVIMISTPSDDAESEFPAFCEKAKQEEAYVELTILDNPMVTEEIIEEYRRECLTQEDFDREYMCKFVTSKNKAIIPEWDEKFAQEINKDEFTQYYHRYVSMDLGTKDFTAVLFGYYDFKQARLVIEDELVMNGPEMTTELLKDAVIATELELWPNKKVYKRISDNNNPLLLQDLQSMHNLRFMATSKDELHAMINEVRLWVKAGRLKIAPKCKQLLGCLKFGVWTDKRDQFARSKVYGHFDALAALVYLIRNIDQHTNPIPITHGFKPGDAYHIEQEPEPQAAKALKQIFNRK